MVVALLGFTLFKVKKWAVLDCEKTFQNTFKLLTSFIRTTKRQILFSNKFLLYFIEQNVKSPHLFCIILLLIMISKSCQEWEGSRKNDGRLFVSKCCCFSIGITPRRMQTYVSFGKRKTRTSYMYHNMSEKSKENDLRKKFCNLFVVYVTLVMYQGRHNIPTLELIIKHPGAP